MSTHPQPDDVHRTCPRCRAEVVAERHESGTVRTFLWRCACGWSRAVSESGVLARRRLLEELAAKQRERDGEPST